MRWRTASPILDAASEMGALALARVGHGDVLVVAPNLERDVERVFAGKLAR